MTTSDYPARLSAFRSWSESAEYTGCRHVQFAGTDCLGVCDVPLPLVEEELRHLLAVGLSVDWAVHEGMLYLRGYQEDTVPDWQYVLSEDDVHRAVDDPQAVWTTDEDDAEE